ncbi:MAG: hypothetical protein H0W08_08720 [Acidobacteria bacterium]|nr:hypothetical protein [Acidobacteriota bacterium]
MKSSEQAGSASRWWPVLRLQPGTVGGQPRPALQGQYMVFALPAAGPQLAYPFESIK